MNRSAWLYAALLVLALAAGLAVPSNAPDSPVPSAKNPGPRGVKLLRLWLQQTGRDVRLLEDGALPRGLKTLVVAAPEGHAVTPEQRAAIEAFVVSGGTLVYLKPRHSSVQRELDEWLQLSMVAGPPRDPLATDPLGATESVQLLAGVGSIRTLADDSVEVGLPAAVPLTKSHSLWWAPVGSGEVFIGSGADLAEAQRLELADNAAFWARLKGPIGFDELHQAPKVKPNLSANLVAALLQLAFCGLAFVLAFAPRLGPPRPTPVEQHRSSLEYVASMGALTKEAHIEPQLAAEAVDRLKRELDLGDFELPVTAKGVKTPQQFLELSRRCAELERRGRG